VLVISIFWGLKFCLGEISPQPPHLVATGMELCSGTNMFFDIVRNDKQLHIQIYGFSRLHTQWCNWWGKRGESPHLPSYM